MTDGTADSAKMPGEAVTGGGERNSSPSPPFPGVGVKVPGVAVAGMLGERLGTSDAAQEQWRADLAELERMEFEMLVADRNIRVL